MDSASQPSRRFEDIEDSEAASHTFVLKVWAEEISEQNDVASWRGRITHVLNGEYIYFENLDTLQQFLTDYLAKLHVDPASRR